MTRAGLYKALSRDGNPSFDTIVKAMRVLGVRLVSATNHIVIAAPAL